MLRGLLVALAALALSGCAITHDAYAPRSAYSLDKDIVDLHAQFEGATSITAYYSAPETDQRRNAFIVGRLTLYDLEYLRFVGQFRLTRAQENAAFDATTLGLGLATTLAGGERAKTVLGAITTAFAGGRSAYEKDFYDDKTSAVLVMQMNAERKTALIPILQGMQSGVGDYPLARAIVDLNFYQFAGTIDGALQGIQKDAAAKDEDASKTIDRFRTHRFEPDAASDRIMAWLYPGTGAVTFDDDGNARDSTGKVITLSTANRDALRAEIETLGLEGLTIEAFLDAGDLADKRAAAITALKIP